MDLVSSLESVVLNKNGGGKDLSSPDMVPLNRDTPICANSDTQAEDDCRKDLCSPKMVALDVFRSQLLKRGFANYSKARLDYIPIGWGPPIPPGECMYCLKVNEHYSVNCPYKKRVPKNATVGDGCAIVCSVCGWFFGGSCCGRDEGCAISKHCTICGEFGHWPTECPSPLRQGKDISFNDGLHSYYPGKESQASQ